MMVAVGKQPFFQNAVVGKLAVEAKTEPLSLVDVLAFKRLCVAAIVLTAGGIPDVPDRGPAGQVTHQGFGLGTMIEPKDFGHGADILAGLQQRRPIGIERRHPGGQLTTILDIQQHPRQQPRNVARSIVGAHWTAATAGQVINSSNTTFVMDFAHSDRFPKVKRGQEPIVESTLGHTVAMGS